MERLLSPLLEHRVATLPRDPGCYLMKDSAGTVIYVGKAKNLKNRVSQYFGTTSGKQSKVAAMVANIDDFEFIITDSEMEALILECNLIKQYRPYYNILLRDDKQFPYVRIDVSDDFPRIEIVRKVSKDGAKYFGPYLAAHMIREVMDAVYKLFPLRSCKLDLNRIKKNHRPCLNYQMGRCLAPCDGRISKEEYRKTVNDVIDLLSGKYKAIEASLTSEMNEASEKLEYERAAALRDKIIVLKKVAEKQKAGFPDLNDKDIFAAAVGERESCVQAFFVRGGKLGEAQRFFMNNADVFDVEDDADREAAVLESFLKQYYSERPMPPKRIFIGADIADKDVIEEWLTDVRGNRVELSAPVRGDNRKLVLMARKNAKEELWRREQRKKRDYEGTVGAATELGEALGIGYVKRLECYDISNTQGTDSVASMVVFTDGRPDKKEYRRFRIKTVEGPNDFASMEEVLTRRLMEGFKTERSDHGFGAAPSLIIVDGGKGQLSSAVSVLESMGLEDMPIAGLAKKEEELFLPGESEPIIFERGGGVYRLITSIRDEAHRFAITYHRSLREKRTVESELDLISGIGPKRKSILLMRFKSIGEIAEASIDTLASTPGIDITTARSVFKHFHDV